jgi:hypothetical protein
MISYVISTSSFLLFGVLLFVPTRRETFTPPAGAVSLPGSETVPVTVE